MYSSHNVLNTFYFFFFTSPENASIKLKTLCLISWCHLTCHLTIHHHTPWCSCGNNSRPSKQLYKGKPYRIKWIHYLQFWFVQRARKWSIVSTTKRKWILWSLTVNSCSWEFLRSHNAYLWLVLPICILTLYFSNM